jgi:ornithine cyclodeaminase
VTVLFPGLSDGIPAYTVKVHAKFPTSNPAIQGVIHLHDLSTGELLAVMDSTLITSVRTGLAGAVAADALARRDAETVAIIGAGAQGHLQLRHLTLVRSIRRATLYDVEPGRAEDLARRVETELELETAPAASVQAAVSEADIVITATWSREPFLFSPMLRPGTHLTTLGADEPGKAEASRELLEAAIVVCDDIELAAEKGPLAAVGLGPGAAACDLTDVLNGDHPGRLGHDALTVFACVGLPFQDLVVAWTVYKNALLRKSASTIDFLG